MVTDTEKQDSLPIAAHLAQQPRITVLGVDYLHLQMDDGSDLYVTEYGRSMLRHLLPQNYWTDKKWFAENSVKLPGTSALYRIDTKPVRGVSKTIVLKWNRMGQDIPGETEATDLDNAEFNSPFEEFSLAIELRNTYREKPGRYEIHKPLAIYVPRKYVEMDLLGRKQYRIEAIQKKHKEVMLDPNRLYAVIYEWIDGLDAVQAYRRGFIDCTEQESLLRESNAEMAGRGFRVNDNKPHHIIVRPSDDGSLATDDDGGVLCGLIDFELLTRTPQHERTVRKSRRKSYLAKQARRFENAQDYPPGLVPVNILGVDYVFGHVESTGGALWVVGKDPVLFDYFLPVKWRETPRKKLSVLSRVYDTITKDAIHLVWRVSRVGQLPDVDPYIETERRILDYGYNSPFEEFAYNIELAAGGIGTTYPRAIYRSGHKPEEPVVSVDMSRYDKLKSITTPDGHPVLDIHHNYMTLWGYWNGPDEMLAERDVVYYRGIDALRAYREHLISREVYVRTIEIKRERLHKLGIEDLDLRGNHLLLSLDRSGRLVMGPDGVPVARMCNFELLRHICPEPKNSE